MQMKPLSLAVATALVVMIAGCTRAPVADTTETDAVRKQQVHEVVIANEIVAEEKQEAVGHTGATGTLADAKRNDAPAEAEAMQPGRDEGLAASGERRVRAQPEPSVVGGLTAPAAPPVPMMRQMASAKIASTDAQGTGRAPLAQPTPLESSAPVDADQYTQPANTEKYADHDDNPVLRVAETPVSTFSIDVDTGAYSNVRRMLTNGALPPRDAVRAEEFINYFDYGYVPPASLATPFSVTTEIAPAPWNAQRQLMLVGIKGYEVPAEKIPASNLVLLIDTSGSMQTPTKLPLLKEAFKQLVPQMRHQDRVSIVVYAGSAGLVLAPTAGDEHEKILAALDALEAGGSTNGGAGIELAYAMAQKSFIENGVNRVVLATDGDFNVGTIDTEALKTMVADKRRSGIALTTLGFGEDNYNDEMAEQLADIGNGNHAYIDTPAEARKVFVDEMSATMLTIAKDVKIQIEFNPEVVAEYRLIGYENRMLRREDFNNDTIDAGEIGAGHDVTALYELTLVGSAGAQIDPLRYGGAAGAKPAAVKSDELGFLRLRYKQPNEDKSHLIEQPLRRSQIAAAPGPRLQFAAAVAAFADTLRGGTHLGTFDLNRIAALARDVRGDDRFGYRQGFVELVQRTQALRGESEPTEVAVAQ